MGLSPAFQRRVCDHFGFALKGPVKHCSSADVADNAAWRARPPFAGLAAPNLGPFEALSLAPGRPLQGTLLLR